MSVRKISLIYFLGNQYKNSNWFISLIVPCNKIIAPDFTLFSFPLVLIIPRGTVGFAWMNPRVRNGPSIMHKNSCKPFTGSSKPTIT